MSTKLDHETALEYALPIAEPNYLDFPGLPNPDRLTNLARCYLDNRKQLEDVRSTLTAKVKKENEELRARAERAEADVETAEAKAQWNARAYEQARGERDEARSKLTSLGAFLDQIIKEESPTSEHDACRNGDPLECVACRAEDVQSGYEHVREFLADAGASDKLQSNSTPPDGWMFDMSDSPLTIRAERAEAKCKTMESLYTKVLQDVLDAAEGDSGPEEWVIEDVAESVRAAIKQSDDWGDMMKHERDNLRARVDELESRELGLIVERDKHRGLSEHWREQFTSEREAHQETSARNAEHLRFYLEEITNLEHAEDELTYWKAAHAEAVVLCDADEAKIKRLKAALDESRAKLAALFNAVDVAMGDSDRLDEDECTALSEAFRGAEAVLATTETNND